MSTKKENTFTELYFSFSLAIKTGTEEGHKFSRFVEKENYIHLIKSDMDGTISYLQWPEVWVD